MNKSGVYSIKRDSDGKAYIGQSTDVVNRIKEHLRALASGKHDNPHLQSAWALEAGWTFEVLEECSTERLCEVEQKWIDGAWPHLFNIARQVDAPPMRGKKMTDAHKRKISEANKGRVVSVETREKIAATKRGVPRSPETIAKTSRSLKGRAAWNKGVPMREEAKLKLSKAKKGTKWSAERRARFEKYKQT